MFLYLHQIKHAQIYGHIFIVCSRLDGVCVCVSQKAMKIANRGNNHIYYYCNVDNFGYFRLS